MKLRLDRVLKCDLDGLSRDEVLSMGKSHATHFTLHIYSTHGRRSLNTLNVNCSFPNMWI